ncbi:MAG: hypothetical protein E7L17_07410 [Clostridium sp.]|uniref:hypothetical protein n=1 Tax=Clostridium sp. TaxID=1506 RepID=UPI00290FAA05|nr:hypothetical protein [Clostridium sp.]MDU7337924.1 hypothetical protein [Clostridium sp.]
MVTSKYGLGKLQQQIISRMQSLEKVRDEFYSDSGSGGRFHSVLIELQGKGFSIPDETLHVVMRFEDLDAINKEITSLKNTINNLEDMSKGLN